MTLIKLQEAAANKVRDRSSPGIRWVGGRANW